MAEKEEPHWQPISALPLIAHFVSDMLEDTEEQYKVLREARERPHLLDDCTVGRVVQVFTAQQGDLWLYEEQLARWKKTALTATQKDQVKLVGGKLERLRQLVGSILSLAEELKGGTIERVLEKSDLELGLEVLLGKRKQ